MNVVSIADQFRLARLRRRLPKQEARRRRIGGLWPFTAIGPADRGGSFRVASGTCRWAPGSIPSGRGDSEHRKGPHEYPPVLRAQQSCKRRPAVAVVQLRTCQRDERGYFRHARLAPLCVGFVSCTEWNQRRASRMQHAVSARCGDRDAVDNLGRHVAAASCGTPRGRCDYGRRVSGRQRRLRRGQAAREASCPARLNARIAAPVCPDHHSPTRRRPHPRRLGGPCRRGEAEPRRRRLRARRTLSGLGKPEQFPI